MTGVLKNKRGEGTYIYLCVLILVISMLLSVLVLYMSLCAQVQIQKRDMRHRLDGYLSEVATLEFDAIKQGEAYEVYLDYDALEANVYEAIGFEPSDLAYSYPDSNCTITRPTVTVLRGEGFGLKLEYEASFPIEWGGRTFTTLTVPVTVTGYFKLK